MISNLDECFNKKISPYYCDDTTILLKGDCIKELKNINEKSVNMIFCDPPYFLSNDGITCQGGKQVSVNKGKWDRIDTFEEKHKFNRKWIKECKRVLDDSGTIWISGTLHNIYSIGVALEQEGFKILNNITWQKTNPPPNLACRCFTHSTETIIWARKNIKKAKQTFNYDLMKEINGGKQMKDVWCGALTPKREKAKGKHPTQKPLYVLEKIIMSSTNENDIVLDCFNGSGTSGVASKMLGRRYIGIELEEEYLEITKQRLGEIKNEKF